MPAENSSEGAGTSLLKITGGISHESHLLSILRHAHRRSGPPRHGAGRHAQRALLQILLSGGSLYRRDDHGGDDRLLRSPHGPEQYRHDRRAGQGTDAAVFPHAPALEKRLCGRTMTTESIRQGAPGRMYCPGRRCICICICLIVVCGQLKIGLRVCTDGTHLRGLFSHMNMTAVAALPHILVAPLKDDALLQVLQKR